MAGQGTTFCQWKIPMKNRLKNKHTKLISDGECVIIAVNFLFHLNKRLCSNARRLSCAYITCQIMCGVTSEFWRSLSFDINLSCLEIRPSSAFIGTNNALRLLLAAKLQMTSFHPSLTGQLLWQWVSGQILSDCTHPQIGKQLTVCWGVSTRNEILRYKAGIL